MEKITLNAEFIIEFANKNEWVNKCPQHLPKKQERAEHWIWVDKNGNVAEIGEDFSAAMAYNSYPIKVYKLIRISKA